MNQASQYLLALAKQKIQPYIANSNARAAMIRGSVAKGEADFHSDVQQLKLYKIVKFTD